MVLVKIPISIYLRKEKKRKKKWRRENVENVSIKGRRIIDGGEMAEHRYISSDDWCRIDSKRRICAIAQLPLHDD